MAPLYYVLFDDQPDVPKGPFDFEQLRALAADRRLSPDSLVARAGEGSWQALRSRPELDGTEFFPRNSPYRLGQRDFERVNEDGSASTQIESWLAVNRQAERSAGRDELSDLDWEALARQSRLSKRMRDYLVASGFFVLVTGLGCLVFPLTLAMMGYLAGFGAIMVAVVTWVMFGAMDPY